MNDAQTTLIGWLAADPKYVATSTGTPLVSLKVGCTPRRYDKETGQWQDEASMFVIVNCWRGLAENVNASDMKRGEPVIVTGRLRIREYVQDERVGHSVEIDAITLGHDLTRGSAQFRRFQRSGTATVADRREAERLADIWLSESEQSEPAQRNTGTAENPAGGPIGYPGGATTGDGEEDDGEELDSYDVQTKAA
jgi:single-strand DNA-binding protein